jgi:hypothetical protein
MRIGLLPRLEMGGGPLGAFAEAPGPRRRPTPITHTRLMKSDVSQPATFGGTHVDFDHQ